MLSRFALEQIVQDVRFACRLLARERAYSAAAIAALALGIGANAAGFTVINAALLRGLPYEASDRLYVISWQNRAGRRVNASYADLEAWRTASTFNGLAAYRDASINISGDNSIPEQTTGTSVTANAFAVLLRRPILGRDFESMDERPGASPVLLISHELWRRRYASDPKAIGALVRINGTPATIIGIMPEGMRFPENSDVWMPLPEPTTETDRKRRVFRVFGRLSDGADCSRADNEMRLLASQVMAASPDASRDLIGVRVETFADRYVGGMGRVMFLTVMGAVVLVLLIACGNVANLLLVRTTARTREMAMRVAVGATRTRIIRQLLVESLVLSVIGGAAGLALAIAGVRIFGIAMQESGLPSWVVFDVDRVVFAYVAALCVGVAVLFGLAPAWHVSKAGPYDVLKEGGRGSVGSVRVRRFGSAMVVMELALTTTVLVGAGLLIRSVLVLHAIDLGFRMDGLLTMRILLPAAKYDTPEARLAFFERLEPQLAAIPGVVAAAVTTGVPPNDGGERLLEIDRPSAASVEPVFVGTVAITPRFFDVLGVSLLHGRNFDGHDGAPGMDTVIVNRRLAAQFFPNEDPIGRRIRFTQREASGRPLDRWRTIVGIAPQIKHGSPQDGYDNAVVYFPYRQEAVAAVSLLVRSALSPETVIAAVRSEVEAIDADQPVLSIQTLSQSLAESQWWWRIWGGVFGVFSSIALILSGLGLYAVIAYSVTQRRQEIGVRMALGAQRLAVCSMILKRALAQLVVGLSLGLAGAFFVSSLLWGRGMIVIPPDDRVTYLAVSVILSGVALSASLLPAYRAAHIDPMVVLRAE